jgi:hypothetical protein
MTRFGIQSGYLEKNLDGKVNSRLCSALPHSGFFLAVFVCVNGGLSDTPSRKNFPVGGLPGRGIHHLDPLSIIFGFFMPFFPHIPF